MLYGLNMQLVWMAGIAAIGVLLLILIIYIGVLNHRVSKLKKNYKFFMMDGDGKSVEAKLREDVAELRKLSGTLEGLHAAQQDILSVQDHCFRKIGFVKYNAFDNIGNNLSFAFTILDGKDDGYCLSSVYGRNESRVFAKPIVGGKCVYGMSEEEKESLEHALNYTGDIADLKKN